MTRLINKSEQKLKPVNENDNTTSMGTMETTEWIGIAT